MAEEPVKRKRIPSERKYELIDLPTPVNAPLSGQYRRSFACYTIQQRLPTILTKVIDNVTRDKNELIDMFGGDVAKAEVKEVIAQISQMKYELQTNKEFSCFEGDDSDTTLWNDFINSLGEKRTYFSATWLYAECYIYRRIYSIFAQTTSLKTYDYFRKQKDAALSDHSIDMVLRLTSLFYRDLRIAGTTQLEDFFQKVLRVSLWGNRCDLSLSCGDESLPDDTTVAAIEKLDEKILANQSKEIWTCLTSVPKPRIDIILDNAGFELFTDLVLADFLLRYDFASTVHLHVKAIPWFISDVTEFDLKRVLDRLVGHAKADVREFGARVHDYYEKQQLILSPKEWFWTSPYEYEAMKRIAPNLYDDLSKSHLLIFKGDLNYRKLLADINWNCKTKFAVALQSFQPTNVCALRTIKADLVCGVSPTVCQVLSEKNVKWMETGENGLIQFAPFP